MIRRVTTPAGSPDLTITGLPPGTPTTAPLSLVYVFPATAQVGSIPADALVTSDGRPVYATGPGRWGQLVQAGGRPLCGPAASPPEAGSRFPGRTGRVIRRSRPPPGTA